MPAIAQILLAALAYVIIVFPLALVWHLKLFPAHYDSTGYFVGEPAKSLGLIAVLLQALCLALLFSRLPLPGMPDIALFCLLAGIFFWSAQVLSPVARGTISTPIRFLLLETVYLVLQFGLYALALMLIRTLG